MPRVQLLRLTDARWPALTAGEKTDTIRWGEARVVPGLLVYESTPSADRHAVVHVEFVRLDVPLRTVLDLTDDRARRPDATTLLRRMRVHYPAITLDTAVDYIRHLTPARTMERYGGDVRRILGELSGCAGAAPADGGPDGRPRGAE